MAVRKVLAIQRAYSVARLGVRNYTESGIEQANPGRDVPGALDFWPCLDRQTIVYAVEQLVIWHEYSIIPVSRFPSY